MKLTSRVILAVLGTVALIASLGSCGGSASLNQEGDSAFVGITQGDFKAVRYNDAGYRDGSLNSTLDLSIEEQGANTVVTINVADNDPMRSVGIDLHYNQARLSPADVSFGGVIDTPVQMAHTGIAGLVAVGQSSTKGVALRSGVFATITFKHEPFNGGKTVQAAHSDLLNVAYTANGANAQGFSIAPTAVDGATPAIYTVYGIFATGDGDQNGESNIADLTPLGLALGNAPGSTDLTGANADYDGNGEVNISDITPLGVHITQSTSAIEIMIGDAADATDTVLESLAWTAGTAPNGAAAVTEPALCWRNWTGDVTNDDVAAADTNADGTVFVSARATDGTTPGNAFDGTAITGTPPINADFVISDIDVQVDAADVNDGDVITPAANATLTLDIVGISGTYQGTPFTPVDAGGAVPQAEYDDTLASVKAGATWTSTDVGDAEMRATAPVTILSGSGPWSAMVFPDDDPESTGAVSEGTLSVTVAASGSQIPGPLTVDLTVDVLVDATAALVDAISPNPSLGQDANGDWLLSAVANTVVTYAFNFGSGGAPGTIDGSTVEAELYCFESATAEALTYVPGAPAAAGEFELLGGGPVLLNALISPSQVSNGLHYTIRIRDVGAGVFTSVNKPGEFLTVAPLPPAAQLEFFPITNPGANPSVNPDTTQITIIWPEPVIRRNPDVVPQLDGTVDKVAPGAFDDQLKNNGNEFQVANISGIGLFPQITWVEGSDTASIGPTTPDGAGTTTEIVLVSLRQPDRVVCDISGLPNGTNIGDPAAPYAFKMFGSPVTPGDKSTRPAIGFGNFQIEPVAVGDPTIVPVDWGINIFNGNGGLDRGTLDVAGRDFSDQNPDSTTFIAPDAIGAPDALFIEFNGGLVGTTSAASNVLVRFHSQADDSEYDRTLKIVCSGLGGTGLNYIGMHVFSSLDLLSEGLGGNLAGGVTYDLSLKDGNDANATAVTGAMFIN
jgi:hypothetical protein